MGKFKLKSYWTRKRRVRRELRIIKNITEKAYEINSADRCLPSLTVATDLASTAASEHNIIEERIDEISSCESLLSSQQHEEDVSDIDDLLNEIDRDSNFDSSSENDEDEPTSASTDKPEPDLKSFLRQWSCDYNVPSSAVSALLKKLKELHPELPSDARTLLRTPRLHAISKLSDGGEYIYLGVKAGIDTLLKLKEIDPLDTTLSLQFNTDGLPLFKSSNTSLWPILCIVRNSKNKSPFPVAFYCGSAKPDSKYFQHFATELMTLLTGGLTVVTDDGRQVVFKVCVHSFVCDAPARAMLKNVKGHTGYFGCDKCHDEGEWQNRMTFPDSSAALRTDIEFAAMSDKEHHLSKSALGDLPIGMVSKFPVEYMHLVCLGVVKRLILYWLKGP